MWHRVPADVLLLVTALFSLVFTNIMWLTAIDQVGAARASLYANLQPFLPPAPSSD